MPEHKIGSGHTFGNLMKAYGADQQGDNDAHFLLYRGDEILALCLRHKFQPVPDEVWVGDAPEVARRGEQLAALKGKQTVPLYYSPPGRTLYEYKGHRWIKGDTTDQSELDQRKGPVRLSRVVYLDKVEKSPASRSFGGVGSA